MEIAKSLTNADPVESLRRSFASAAAEALRQIERSSSVASAQAALREIESPFRLAANRLREQALHPLKVDEAFFTSARQAHEFLRASESQQRALLRHAALAERASAFAIRDIARHMEAHEAALRQITKTRFEVEAPVFRAAAEFAAQQEAIQQRIQRATDIFLRDQDSLRRQVDELARRVLTVDTTRLMEVHEALASALTPTGMESEPDESAGTLTVSADSRDFFERQPWYVKIVVLVLLEQLAESALENAIQSFASAESEADSQQSVTYIQSELGQPLTDRVRVVDATGLNVRAAPNKDAAELTELKRGALVILQEIHGKWAFVRYSPDPCRQLEDGWVAVEFLRTLEARSRS